MADEIINDGSKEAQTEEPESTVIRISYKSMFKVGFVIILAIVLVMLFKGFNIPTATGNVVALDTGNTQTEDVQYAKMKVVGSQYVIEPNSFKVGVPVRIEADINNMPGCSKSIAIPSFNIRKVLTSGDNIIEFTPIKAGTFNIACSMNMYKGTFTVLESDGTKSDYVETASSAGASCGSGGSGCGCGG